MKAVRLVCVVFALVLSAAATAQTWPSKPVTLVFGYPAGTGVDAIARFLAEQLRERTGQPFLVEARPGAFANIAAQHVARSAPDGYTVLMTPNSTHAANVHLFKELGFHPVKDFMPVTTILLQGFVLLVNPSVAPVRSVAELTQYIRERPGKVAYGAGAATARIATELYLQLGGGLDVTYVPYKGSNQALNDLLGGQIHFFFAEGVSGMQAARGGKARALAVTNTRRNPCAPDIPTMAEAGLKEYDLASWWGLFLPARTPPEIAARLAELTNASWASEKGREFLRKICVDPFPGSPESLAKLVESDTAKWGRIIRQANIQPQ